jgi:hypothetical protein
LRSSTTLLVDGHVHSHPCFGLGPFLRSAQHNVRRARGEVGQPNAFGCLMFTESAWAHDFEAFRGGLIESEAPGWVAQATDEDDSLFVTSSDGARLLLVAGRQVVTSERLEVLALATAQEYEDGLPLREAATMVAASGAVPVLPWGFGKWTGRRERAVHELLSSPLADDLYLGDNGGRPSLGWEPRMFRLARERGIPVLPGSDPLPIAAEVGKPGRYGFVLEGPLNAGSPAASIRAMIATRAPVRPFGRLERLPTFVLRQTQLRIQRRGTPRKVDEAADTSVEPQRS